MFPGKHLIIGVAVSSLFFAAGCNKKKDATASKVSQPSASQPAAGKTGEAEDIFNEFYKDENTSAQKENFSSKETFSPSGTGTTSQSYSGGDEFSPNGRYVVQISTVVSERFAEKIKSKLTSAGIPAYVAEVQNPRPDLSGTFYRIRIGGFKTLSAAKNFAENGLKSMGYSDYWIDNKANDNVGISGGSFGSSSSSYDNSSYQAPQPTPVSTITEPQSTSDWGSSSSQTPSPASQPSQPVTPAPAAVQTTPAPAPAPAPAPSQASVQPATPAAPPASSQTSTPAASSTSNPAATPASPTTTDTSGWGTSGW